jgi:hypothetical protein
MHKKNALEFLTSALYADSQAIVKNVIYTTARLQIADKGVKQHILHEGSDRLERTFCDVCTHDHNPNVDALQCGHTLSMAAEISAILERNPDLDRGHRRLELSGAEGVDHINPKSWKGNVEVGTVDLLAEWNGGRDDANNLLVQTFGENARVDFPEYFLKHQGDILCPKGTYIGVTEEPGDARSEEEPESASPDIEREEEDNENPEFDDLPEGMDLEDILEASEDDSTNDDNFLMIEGTMYQC